MDTKPDLLKRANFLTPSKTVEADALRRSMEDRVFDKQNRMHCLFFLCTFKLGHSNKNAKYKVVVMQIDLKISSETATAHANYYETHVLHLWKSIPAN